MNRQEWLDIKRSKEFHKIGAGNQLIPKGGLEECDCHALNWLVNLIIIF